MKGYLPWRKLKDKDKIGELKIKLNTPELVRDLPNEFLVFMDHLQALEFTDRPDYGMLISLLEVRIHVYDFILNLNLNLSVVPDQFRISFFRQLW